MRFRPSLPAGLGRLTVAVLVLAFTGLAATAADLKFQAVLVWATNAEKPTGSNLKPVEAGVRKKLKELPLKWANFFEVNRVDFTVAEHGSNKAKLSDKCQIEVADVDRRHVEVSLIGKGEPVLKRTQPLPKGEMLVLGGNAPDSSGWLVVLKRVE
jgi:hypothetical protein